MQILKIFWDREQLEMETKTSCQYFLDWRSLLQDTCIKLGKEELAKVQVKRKRLYDSRI